MYTFGQELKGDDQLYDHVEHGIPVQIYLERHHADIGFIEKYSEDEVQVNHTSYSRKQFTIISRPGY